MTNKNDSTSPNHTTWQHRALATIEADQHPSSSSSSSSVLHNKYLALPTPSSASFASLSSSSDSDSNSDADVTNDTLPQPWTDNSNHTHHHTHHHHHHHHLNPTTTTTTTTTSSSPSPSSTPSGRRPPGITGPHECQECGKLFTRARDMRKHVREVHRGEIGPASECSVCGAVFRRGTSLKRHLKVHTMAKDRPHRCQHCPSFFRKATPSNTPASNHSNESYHHHRHRCEHIGCGQVFGRQRDLLHHVRVHHHGRLPPIYPCRVCGKRLTTLAGRRRHESLHQPSESQDRYPCPEPGCGRVYRRRGNLQAHIRSRHSGKRFPCPFCSRTYAFQSGTDRHVRSVHREREREYREHYRGGRGNANNSTNNNSNSNIDNNTDNKSTINDHPESSDYKTGKPTNKRKLEEMEQEDDTVSNNTNTNTNNTNNTQDESTLLETHHTQFGHNNNNNNNTNPNTNKRRRIGVRVRHMIGDTLVWDQDTDEMGSRSL